MKNEKVIFKNSDEISLEILKEFGIEIEDHFNLEESIIHSLEREVLQNALNRLSNDEYKVISEIFYNCKSEIKLAKELNCCNVVLYNKRKKFYLNQKII